MRFTLNEFLLGMATVLMSLTASTSHAGIVFTNNVLANFKFTAVVGNPLGLPDNLELDFVATGSMTFSLDDSIPNATSMAFTNATGTLSVIAPTPFAGATMGPYEFVGGELQKISRDALGNIIGGDVVDLRMKWQMFVPTPGGPIRLYTTDSLPFNGAMTGVPFQIGNVLAGPDPFDVYLDTGFGSRDPLAVIGSNRLLTVTAVPEPSSFAMLAVVGLVCAGYRIRSAKPRSR